jgi:hypothetical protein
MITATDEKFTQMTIPWAEFEPMTKALIILMNDHASSDKMYSEF